MKKFNLAALPLAVAGVLASNAAFAGTEACFEVYTAADLATATAFDTKYDLAACTRGAASDTAVQTLDPMAIAYELTGDNLAVEFEDIDAAISVASEDLILVYVPTTDIPGGTKITMKLTGSKAVFNGNGNQIHLVKDSGDATNFEAVGSSDGTLDGSDTAVFLTKAGVTIGAGTRLVLSRNSTGTLAADFAPIGVLLDNDDCTEATSASSVKIASVEAITDGGTGYSIQGAVSDATTIIDVSPQFWALQDGETAEVEVNAESSDSGNVAIVARTEFVYDKANVDNQLVAKQYEAVYKTAFYNTEPNLDQYITLDADDHLETAFVSGTDAGSEVEMGLWNARTAATGVLGTQEDAETATTWGVLSVDAMAPTVYNTEALDVFPEVDGGLDAEVNPHTTASDGTIKDGAEYNEFYYVVTNNVSDPLDPQIMNFNYTVDTKYTLDFGTAGELDHCAQEKETHQVGVNGAVLKVPYTVTADGNFVRITNEHDEEAEITFDMFGESDNGTEANRKVTALSLGTVPAQSSVVYFMNDVLEVAEAAGYVGADGGYAAGDLGSNFKSADNRHTVTFTVTAPRDSVHGVSVQKIIGGLDRVMPVLDQNAWSQ